MPTISFFPWATFDKAYKNGNFILLPIDLNKAPPSEVASHWDSIKTVVGFYYNRSNHQIKRSAIILLANTQTEENYDENKLDEIFVYREIICFSGIANRLYFDHGNYCSSDTLKLVVQRFQVPASEPSISVRRRDGNTLIGFSPGIFKEYSPLHISPNGTTILDESMLDALIKAYEYGGDEWSNIHDAIQNFNLGNSDSSEIRPQTELVLTVSSCERLFGLIKGKEDDLAGAVVTALSGVVSEVTSLPEKKTLKPELAAKCTSIREAWIRDIFRLRNRYAHGRNQPKYDYSWAPEEHLLLMSYIFPLLVKIKLQNLNLYSLSDDDVRKIYTFDYVLNLNGTRRAKQNDKHSYVWNQSISAAAWDYESYKIAQKP